MTNPGHNAGFYEAFIVTEIKRNSNRLNGVKCKPKLIIEPEILKGKSSSTKQY